MSFVFAFDRVKNSILNRFRIKKYKVIIQGAMNLNGIVYFYCQKPGSIFIGSNFNVNSGRKYNPIGGDKSTLIITSGDGCIIIGNNVGISNSTIFAHDSITIEDNVRIGGSCKIYDSDFHAINFDQRMEKPDTHIAHDPVVIKMGAFIGAHCIILKGVTVGEKSVIGSGSVVTKNVPDGEIWAGNPAKFVRKV